MREGRLFQICRGATTAPEGIDIDCWGIQDSVLPPRCPKERNGLVWNLIGWSALDSCWESEDK